jgi:hypothetical protein
MFPVENGTLALNLKFKHDKKGITGVLKNLTL